LAARPAAARPRLSGPNPNLRRQKSLPESNDLLTNTGKQEEPYRNM